MSMIELARATVTLPNDPKFGGGTRDEVATITHYPEYGVVRIEVEHYDGARAVELSLEKYAAFRAAVIDHPTGTKEGGEEVGESHSA